MITRKDNLLIRPFQQKQYVEHRKKVNRALPRIDDISPPQRSHVYVKCKKLQTEAERHARIERDNFILLKHLNEIMTGKRIDNCWLYKHPKFLRRIKLFEQTLKIPNKIDDLQKCEEPKRLMRERCIACYPEKFVYPKIIPEERVPWELKPVREYKKKDELQVQTMKIAKQSKKLFFSGKDCTPQIMIRPETQHQPHLKKEPLLKRRSDAKLVRISSTEETKGRISLNQKPLTVVMKFPSTVQVTLQASEKKIIR